MIALKSGQRGLVVVVSTNTARAVRYVSRIQGCPGKHPALGYSRKVAKWRSCTREAHPVESILWHPLGIHAGCNGGKQKQTVGKKYMSLATQDVVVKGKKRVKQNMSWGETVGQ